MFITFEGIDGSGKTTQIDRLQQYFESVNRKCHIFREPGGTVISEKIRNLLLHGSDEMDPVTELLLFSAARSQLISEKVTPLLEKSKIVILDRFYDSTTAYQGYGRHSASILEINQLNRLASHHTVPDLTFYLKVSPETAQTRTIKNEKDRMERLSTGFFQKVSDGFDEISRNEDRIKTIDARLDADIVYRLILNEVEKIL